MSKLNVNIARDAITFLRDPVTIRQRSQQLFKRALENHSDFFKIDLNALDQCCEFVLSNAKQQYPNFDVPFHSRFRHYEMDNISRLSQLKTPQQQFELIIISVLLDAGAGTKWQFFESSSGKYYGRSEGLALAALEMYQQGYFSKTGNIQADSEGLAQITPEKIAQGMQHSEGNPLLGLEGRASLVRNIANIMQQKPNIFGKTQCLGDFYDHLLATAKIDENTIDAKQVLLEVLETFADIWPGRIILEDTNLGDVWQHSAIEGEGLTNGLIPFHKLSQWLTYSLLEPFINQGFQLTNLDLLTGLAEYRNGGLFVDTNVIALKDNELYQHKHQPDSALIIEWRALTICLLDDLWQKALQLLGKDQTTLPLVSFLEAGTWKAGRIIAKQKRDDASPPIAIQSDGTVF